jgi:twitching motility protein PilT
MAGIDSLLRMLVDNAADELRLMSDEPPRMLKRGAPVRLAIPPTPDDILRHLLGPIFDEHEAALAASGKVELRHALGRDHFAVTMQKKSRGMEVVFRRGAAPVAATSSSAHAPSSSGHMPPSTGHMPLSTGYVPPSSGHMPPSSGNMPPSTGHMPPSSGNTLLSSAHAPQSSGGTASSSAQASPASGHASPSGAHAPPHTPSSAHVPSGAHAPPSGHVPPAAGYTQSPPLVPLHVMPIAQDVSDQPIAAGITQLTPTPQLQALLARAAALGASDVHLAQGEPPTLRIDGQLRTLDEPLPDLVACLSGVANLPELTRAQHGRSVDLAFTAPGLGRFRLNLYRAADQLAAAIRLLPPHVPTLGQLRLPSLLEELVAAPHGLIIVCGPTGSGKSATLAALVQAAMRRRPGLVITLEDPVEYMLEAGPGSLVRQRQVGRDVIDFATGLRDALREDPDVMLIGEMRDPESISLAITAAETGHLVLTSLHARSAASSIERMVDSYPRERQQQIRVQLADALRGVVAQRLIPRARGEGRVPAVEVLRLSHAVASMLREGRTEQIPSTIQSGRKEGMVPLERSLAELVKSAQITREHAFAVANDVSTLSSYLQDQS